MFRRLFILTFFFSFLSQSLLFAQHEGQSFNFNFSKADTLWADSVMRTFSDRDKIAQLFMIKAFTNQNQAYYDKITRQICDYKVGGVCFFKGTPTKEAILTNYWQSIAQTPLFIAIDGEWGLGMRLDSTISFPRQMTLGAIKNDSLIYQMGSEIADQCKRLGITIDFAPVVDVNSNRANPVINSRSFGENKYRVAEKGIVYMKSLQNNGVMACAKHFPGHGDTDTDSHKTLPVINHSFETIDTLDLYPFKQLFLNNVAGTMVAHLHIPAIDTSKNSTSTLSSAVVTDLLKNKLRFKGLVFTDAMDMNGVSKFNKPGAGELKAVLAGNDIILLPQNLPEALSAIQQAIDSCIICQEDIDSTCRKILIFKHNVGLDHNKPVKINHLYEDLNSQKALLLQRNLYENAVTLLQNRNNIIPLRNIESYNIAVVSFGDTNTTAFQQTLADYAFVDFFNIEKYPKKEFKDSILKVLTGYDLVIAGIHNTSMVPNYGITHENISMVDSLQRKTKVILDIFGNPYSLYLFNHPEKSEAVIVSYQENKLVENLSAQMIMGGIKFNGRLPVTASSEYPYNSGIESNEILRLKYTMPEEIGIDSKYLKKIDSIALYGIEKHAYPGCQVLLVKNGKVFYRKSFGYHTYTKKTPVSDFDLYDMASITKIEATTIAMMELYDEGKINLDAKIGKYLPLVKGSNKADLLIRDIMTHQAGLQAWIPFYLKTITNGSPDTNIYRRKKSDKFSLCVADSLYILKSYTDTILKRIIRSSLNQKKEYLYSDMGFYLLKEMIEKITKTPFEKYLVENFYKPLGMAHTCFNPLSRFNIKEINPTENDTVFRHQIVHGYVHDPGAAMLGGISGHAGLFSNANDLAIFLQMILQKGEYGGVRYLKENTVSEFTRYQFPENDNRRGLGFDKPALPGQKSSPACASASPESFGHTGFTGTFFWVDPKENLIVIMLTNRVFPDASNTKLTELNIRTSLQQAVYDAIYLSRKENSK